MKKIKQERKQEEICAWGSEQEIEKEAILPPPRKTKDRGMLPEIGLKHRFPSMDLNEIHKKHKKNRHQEEINRLAEPKRLKTESYEDTQTPPIYRPKNNGIRLFPSLPMLLSPHLKKVTYKQPLPIQKIQLLEQHPISFSDFKKYEENDQLSFKLLSTKQNIEPVQTRNPETVKKGESKSTLKVKTIEIISKDIKQSLKEKRKQPISVNVKRSDTKEKEKYTSRNQKNHQTINNLLSIKQNFIDNPSEFNDHTIFLRHPELYYTEVNSPTQHKKETQTERFRLIIK